MIKIYPINQEARASSATKLNELLGVNLERIPLTRRFLSSISGKRVIGLDAVKNYSCTFELTNNALIIR